MDNTRDRPEHLFAVRKATLHTSLSRTSKGTLHISEGSVRSLEIVYDFVPREIRIRPIQAEPSMVYWPITVSIHTGAP